jgi:3-deoxy-manno-octulosonate cytidylyltransferase (CMP-KDO synthetase)
MKVIGVIPCRLASTRLPGKALADIAGKPMIQHVFERAREAALDEVLIATDSEEIAEVARSFGASVEMTSSEHTSGTERVIEVSSRWEADFYLNIQGDEPLIDPRLITDLANTWRAQPEQDVLTAANPRLTEAEYHSPHAVKVVLGQGGQALYFSRAPIPYRRDPDGGAIALKHIGIYGYTPRALELFRMHPPGRLERTEQLEQLRFLEIGVKIQVLLTDYQSIGVDTEEDLRKVREVLA